MVPPPLPVWRRGAGAPSTRSCTPTWSSDGEDKCRSWVCGTSTTMRPALCRLSYLAPQGATLEQHQTGKSRGCGSGVGDCICLPLGDSSKGGLPPPSMNVQRGAGILITTTTTPPPPPSSSSSLVYSMAYDECLPDCRCPPPLQDFHPDLCWPGVCPPLCAGRQHPQPERGEHPTADACACNARLLRRQHRRQRWDSPLVGLLTRGQHTVLNQYAEHI